MIWRLCSVLVAQQALEGPTSYARLQAIAEELIAIAADRIVEDGRVRKSSESPRKHMFAGEVL
jgi:hypothetical protein